MTQDVNAQNLERYQFLCIAYANDPERLEIVKHYGPEELHFTHEHLRLFNEATRNERPELSDRAA